MVGYRSRVVQVLTIMFGALVLLTLILITLATGARAQGMERAQLMTVLRDGGLVLHVGHVRTERDDADRVDPVIDPDAWPPTVN